MCLRELAASPEHCLVRTLLESWYADKSCAYCGKAVGKIDWLHHPTLMDPATKTTHEWNEIAPRDLPEVFKTHHPVCWNCHIAETFRREHPDLVTDRNWQH